MFWNSLRDITGTGTCTIQVKVQEMVQKLILLAAGAISALCRCRWWAQGGSWRTCSWWRGTRPGTRGARTGGAGTGWPGTRGLSGIGPSWIAGAEGEGTPAESQEGRSGLRMRCCTCPCLRTMPPCWPPPTLLPLLPPSLLRLRLPVRLPPPLRPTHGTGQASETVALTTQSQNFYSQDQPVARPSRIRLLSL